MAAIALSVEKLTKSYNDKQLFNEITFGIDQGQKVALVGVNGCGKSTLLNVIAGKEKQDTGIVSFNKNIKVAYLDQSPDLSEFKTILDSILDANHPEAKVLNEYWKIIEKPEMDEKDQSRMEELIDTIESMNAWDYEYRLKEILGKLGINDLDQPISELSGGQQKRIALAKALLGEPQFLILDEPTNHLDLEIIEWLEEFLAAQNLSLLMVTHDRYFLDKVCNEIIEIDNGDVYKYKGSYSYYLEKKQEHLESQQVTKDKARNLLSKELEWMRRQPKARGTKSKSRIEAFYDTKEKANVDLSRSELEIKISGKRQGKKILEIEKISKAWEGKTMFKDFSYVFAPGEKVGIVGKNGTGKSTFLNVLTEKIQPDTGELSKGVNTAFGYYTQDTTIENPTSKVIDIVKEVAEVITLNDGSTVTASQLLNQFLFPPKTQHSFVAKLSGGEKRRLQLLKVLMANPNFLVLDEPTNDLDIVTLNILEDYLNNFAGSILIVSHDRYFMDKMVDHLLVFDHSDQITDFLGNYTDFREADIVTKDKKQKTAAKKVEAKEKDEEKKKLSYNEQQEFKTLEKDIAKLESEKKEFEQLIISGETDHEKLNEWAQKIKKIQASIDEKEMRWLELSEWA